MPKDLQGQEFVISTMIWYGETFYEAQMTLSGRRIHTIDMDKFGFSKTKTTNTIKGFRKSQK